ncbi:MAG TPA: hypothetical protein VKW76_04645 [Candidatus Binatia bacterium]|nr:hypothetical protein [Candidatus Binatia bacterium]
MTGRRIVRPTVPEHPRWPEPTTDPPTAETVTQWLDDGRCAATDGCWIEANDDACEHGHPSWAIVLGYIPDPQERS